MMRTLYYKVRNLILRALPTGWLIYLADECLRSRIKMQELVRQRRARLNPNMSSDVRSFDNQRLYASVLERNPVWHTAEFPCCTIPGMLTDEEKIYYLYITKFFSGIGSIVELGSWLGQSTFYLLNGLQANPHFRAHKLVVYDDFVWRPSWMEKWLVGTNIKPPKPYGSFEPLFLEQISEYLGSIEHHRAKINDYDGNETMDRITWQCAKKIEMIVVDCGRMLSVNQAWWDIFSPSFIPGKTLIIMQDWQCCKSVPEVYWENTKIFTDSKAEEIELVHEVADACIATFLYCGKQKSLG